MVSYSLTVNNRELLLPTPEERTLEPQPRLPPLSSFSYSPHHETARLKNMSVEQILQLGVHRSTTTTYTPWNPLFTERSTRGIFDSTLAHPRRGSSIFEPTSTAGRVTAFGSVSLGGYSSVSSGTPSTSPSMSLSPRNSSSTLQSRSNSGVSEMFSRHSSVSSNTATSGCGCHECDEPVSVPLPLPMPVPVPASGAKKCVAIQPATPQLLAKQKIPAQAVHHSVVKPKSRKVQVHLTGKSTRQRVGPSCDVCRRKKIKCDAYIEVVEQDLEDGSVEHDEESNKVTDQELVARFISTEDQEQGFKLLFANGKLIRFRNCSFCEAKGQEAQFERGFTKQDTVLHSVMRVMNKARKRMS